MLQSISLRNFKVFNKATQFRFGALNLLTGVNGRGKSTLLQSLLLFKQSLEDNENTQRLLLNGSCVHLGNFSDVKHVESSNQDTIDIGFSFKDLASGFELNLHYEFEQNEEDEVVLNVRSCRIQSNRLFKNRNGNSNSIETAWMEDKNRHVENWGVFSSFDAPSNILNRFSMLPLVEPEGKRVEHFFSLKKIHYIAADRLGPQNFYYKSQLPGFVSVDKQGHNLATVAFKKRQEALSDSLCLSTPEYEGVVMSNVSKTLETQIGNWLGYITDTHQTGIHFDGTSNDYIITLHFLFGDKRFKPANVGFGYSYILPIVVSGLLAKAGDMLLIENPEAHLHPRAQSRLTHFLARIANQGVQVFVESHSDHVLNSVRVTVKKGFLPAEQANILYFSNEGIQTPKVDKDGRIDEWPEGFFDEWDLNLMELL